MHVLTLQLLNSLGEVLVKNRSMERLSFLNVGGEYLIGGHCYVSQGLAMSLLLGALFLL